MFKSKVVKHIEFCALRDRHSIGISDWYYEIGSYSLMLLNLTLGLRVDWISELVKD